MSVISQQIAKLDATISQINNNMSNYQNTTEEINNNYQQLLKEVQLYYTHVKTLNTYNGLDAKLNYARLNIDIPKYVTEFMKATKGTGNSQDANGINSLSFACLIGNAFSGEQYFYSSGSAKADGTKWNKDTTTIWATSGSKLFQSIGFMKMIEEGLIDPALPIKSYIPEFTGEYSYYIGDTCNVTYIPTTAVYKPGDNLFDGSIPGFPAWTGQIGKDLLDNITVRDAMSLNICYPSNIQWIQARNVKDWTEAPSNAEAVVDKSFLCSCARFYEACWRGYNLGTPEKAKDDPKAIWSSIHADFIDLPPNKTSVNGGTADFILSVIKTSNNGSVPWGGKVGDTMMSRSGLKLVKGTYSNFTYGLLGGIAEVAVRRAGYKSSAEYIRKKFLEPMKIPYEQCWCDYIEKPPANWPQTIAESQFRRTEQFCKGYLSAGVDPKMVIDGDLYKSSGGTKGFPFNSVFWASQYPDDKIANIYTPTFDPDYETNYLTKNKYGASFGGNYFITLDAWSKMYSMYINKGVYNGVRYLSRGMWNYSQMTAVPAGAHFMQYGANNSLGNHMKRWTISHGMSFTNSAVTELYMPSTYDPGSNTSMVPVPGCNNENNLFWSGAFGNCYYLDFDTGLYIFQVNQVSSFGNRAKNLVWQGMVPYCL